MIASPYELCDNDRDGDCDDDDYLGMRKSLGSCDDGTGGSYNQAADYDLDGCVEEEDLKRIFPEKNMGVPIGPETEAFFDEVVEGLQKQPPGEPMRMMEIPWCDEACNPDEFCHHRRQVCSNRTNDNIHCEFVGENQCHKRCEDDTDCPVGRCITSFFCDTDICDIDYRELRLPLDSWEERICE
ncbi:MAG: hypothetical protein ABH950_08945 [Candidatus Altiarchaeota archaeon]